MRVGVKEAIDQDLFHIGAKQFVSQVGASFKLQQTQRAQVGNVLAGNVLHGQHARSSEVLNRHRNNQLVECPQIFAQPDEVACFALKIQFAQETPAQVCLQMAKFIALTDFGVRVDEVGDFL